MDSTVALLKEEINKTLESEHDLAKWKLGVTAALGATAFGLTKQSDPNYWLLLFVPFVCVYIDLYVYQYQSRIKVIANFLRLNAEGDGLLQKYEKECERLRGENVFSLGNWAGLGCSLGASILGPAFYLVRNMHDILANRLLVSHAIAGVVWLVGLGLIIYLWYYSQAEGEKVSRPAQKQPTVVVKKPA